MSRALVRTKMRLPDRSYDRASEDALKLAAIERPEKKGANLFRLDLSTFD
jgi:hypothetical protein